jgi:hypothetical protein
MDYAHHLPGAIELTSNFRFVEQTIAHQSDRVRVPEGLVRLAHRNFGLSAGYRPTETRDSRGFVLRQRDLTLTGNAQRPGLPTIAGTWVRTRLDPNAFTPGSATIARSLSSQYTVPHATFRAGYGDRLLEQNPGTGSRLTENHLSLGSTSQFQVGRAPIAFQYDYSQARVDASLDRSQRSRAHLASVGTNFALDRKTSTTLSYNYRRTLVVGAPRSVSQEHNGGLSVSHVFNPVVQISGGAGVRSAILSGRTETERFVSATASAQGEARPGWRMSAAATHSVNWLPGDPARPADNFLSSTTMRLTKGLDLRGDFSVTTARLIVVPPDTTTFTRQTAVQTSAGISARPLRSVYLDASVNHSRAGTALFGGGVTANSYSVGLRLTPYTALQMSGRWGLTEASGSRGSTAQASLQWALASSFQISAGYNHARQEVSLPAPGFVSRQEGLNGTVAVRLAQDLNASAQYNESNRGQPNRVRQLTVNVVRNFGN